MISPLSMFALSAVLSMTEYKVETIKELKEKTENGKHLFEFVSLFAGGGGSSTGYRMAGGKALAVNEFIPEAVKTYRANWPSTHIFEGDIRNLAPDDILKKIGKKKGELDLLDGSPPCSAFSSAGSREKGWGKTKYYSETKQENIEDLFFDYIRMVDGIQPRIFIAENVSGLAKGKAKGYLNEIIRGLRACGYTVNCKILDAKWLGVPQSRQRVIFVGVRNDLWLDEFAGNLHPRPHAKIVPLKFAFKGLVLTDKDKAETSLQRFSVYKLLTTLKPGQTHTKAFTLTKNSPNKNSQCITATTGKIGARETYHWDNRAHTVAEIKRIMSVPDDYILTGDYSKQVERLGRMVAPFMYKELCKNLIDVGVL